MVAQPGVHLVRQVVNLAAAEVSVGLALIIQMFRRFKGLDSDRAGTMKG